MLKSIQQNSLSPQQRFVMLSSHGFSGKMKNRIRLLMRLSKYLSQKGICSRQAELFIQNGWLRVDGNIVCEPGTQVEQLSGRSRPQAQEYQKRLLTILLNKPVGYVSSQPEKNYKPAVSLIKRQTQFKVRNFRIPERLIGRLTGLHLRADSTSTQAVCLYSRKTDELREN